MQSMSNALHTLSGLNRASTYLTAMKARAHAKLVSTTVIAPTICQVNIDSLPLRQARQDVWSGYNDPEGNPASEEQEQA